MKKGYILKRLLRSVISVLIIMFVVFFLVYTLVPRDNIFFEELRMLEPFPEKQNEKVHGDKPMNMNDMTMEAVLEMYE